MADKEKDEDEAPLSSEALSRDDWRGGETLLDEDDAAGHILPESERGRTEEGGGGSRSGPLSATILPPD